MAKSVRSSALDVEDEFFNLKEALRSVSCLQGLLSPIQRSTRYEEFSIEPGDLRALMTMINDELERRVEPLEHSIRSLRKALKRKAKAKAKEESAAEG